jgi:hypothetical protein
MLQYVPNITSIHLGGSSSRKEETFIIQDNQVVLLGNIALIVFTQDFFSSLIGLKRVQGFLKNLPKYATPKVLEIDRPLVLMKPFEISVLPERKAHFLSPDISIFEIASNNSLLYGKDMREHLSREIPQASACKIIMNRLLGLNLCMRDLLIKDLHNPLIHSMINYESAKGVLAVVEALLVLEQKYKASYNERIAYWPTLIANRPHLRNELPCIDDCVTRASLIRSNPETGMVDPYSFWFQSRTLLLSALTYLEKNYGLHYKNTFFSDPSLLSRVGYLFLNNRLDLESIKLLRARRAKYYSLMLKAIRIPREDLTVDNRLLEELQIEAGVNIDSSKDHLSQYLDTTSKINFACTNAELRWLTDKTQIIK